MSEKDLKAHGIVADIGGTFARFCRVNLGSLVLDKMEIFPCANFVSFEAAFRTYQSKHSLVDIDQVAIAIACPVMGDFIVMTNCHWRFSVRDVQEKLGLNTLKVINDFSAISMSLPALRVEDLCQIGTGAIDKSKPRVVLGAGTGLGLAYLLTEQNGYKAVAGEGGHASWGATTEQEWFIYNYLKQQYGHVSHERLLSGQGLENLYAAISAFLSTDTKPLSAADIIATALKQQNQIATLAVSQFFSCLGRYAGDLALSLGAFGGVYLAGGIVPRLLPLLHKSDFRTCFENKGRFQSYNATIATYAIIAEQPGLLGAAVTLQQSLQGALNVVC